MPKREKGESNDSYERKVEKQWPDAIAQICRYAVAPRVETLRQGTRLHNIVMQFDGYKLKRMEEITVFTAPPMV